jgi:DNA-binding PadR family transcriptional regulator
MSSDAREPQATTARPLNATAASLLGFLADGPQSGWDLVATAERSIGAFWALTRSQVYRELAAMEGDGLVEAAERGARDRRAFRLTEHGRAAFQAWLEEQPSGEQIRYPLLLKLAFARHLPDAVVAGFVAQHRAEHRARLEAYEAASAGLRAAGADERDLITLDFGLRYERAVLEWFEGLPEAWRPNAR